ncbi:glycosyltransferase family 2 protein [Pseudonocardia sp. ICBG1293]|uniref:glycosyltransferase n=1 Tax=Pseudonocardia sp. ICBG1293 TaxID=2844382 RepID=UPI001CCBCF80|nr:glycosyltransferase family 2 protein [Pseudonocardia sp. ICBG1293]
MSAAGVLVPAHDEAGTVAACVRSVLTALDQASGLTARALCVVADRCSDGTAALARAAAAAHPAADRVRVTVLEPTAGVAPLPGCRRASRRDGVAGPVTIGAVRELAARTLSAVLAAEGADPATTWLLGTDADGTVVPGWVAAHLALAADGADAVAGGVVLDVPGLPRPPGEPVPPEHPVYGANLGVRADAWAAVGGFPPLACGEDHGLVARLRAAGYRVVAGAPGTVRTSARTHGRARGGLADLLRDARPAGPPRAGQGVGTGGAGMPVA